MNQFIFPDINFFLNFCWQRGSEKFFEIIVVLKRWVIRTTHIRIILKIKRSRSQ